MNKLNRFSLVLLALLGVNELQAQLNYTFTPAGATGNVGPTQVMVDNAYIGTTLDGDVTVNGGIQYWVVPATGLYQIESYGGQGYGPFGGRGAYMSGEFPLTGGDTLKILVGQMAGHYLNYPSTTYNHQFGGGGGSFVTYTNNTPLIVAGGGGGNHGTAYVASCDGQTTTAGAAGANASTVGAGGTGGMGGLQATSADGGGGLLGNGTGAAAGQAFVNGGLGGIDEGTGGFGCGGGTSSWNNYRGGGGGGYSGGGGGNNGGTCCPAGGGGGSYNAGTNQNNLAGIQTGDGLIVITPLTKVPNDAGISEIKGFAPPVCKGTYPVDVLLQNFGNNTLSSADINWSVNGVMQTGASYTGALDTNGGVGPDTAIINLGNITITTGTIIKVWTTSPNGVSDTSNYNDTTEIMIAAPATVNVIVTTPISCNGMSDGAISAIVSGGVASYSYTWGSGDTTSNISGLAAGNYTIMISDNVGCTDTMMFNLNEPTVLGAMDITTDISCNGANDGESVIAPTGGTPGYTTIWAPSDTTTFINALSAGYYAYTVVDAHGCTYMDSVLVNEPAAITINGNISNETTTGSNDGSVDLSVSGGTSPYAYSWNNGSGNEDINGLAAGTYLVTVTDANGCSDTMSFNVGSGVGISELENGIAMSIYPNPSNGMFTVSTPSISGSISIEVLDVLGKRILFIQNAKNETLVNLSGNSGIYIVRVSNGEQTASKRVIVK